MSDALSPYPAILISSPERTAKSKSCKTVLTAPPCG